MKNLIPFPPSPFGAKCPEFYRCRCEQCGFTQTYEISDCEVISLEGMPDNSDTAFVQAKKLPQSCPKCSGKLKRTKVPTPIKY